MAKSGKKRKRKLEQNGQHSAHLSALKLYEEAASKERETMRMSILPGREPPSTDLSTPQHVVPAASDSRLLPTDPEAIEYPNKTLVTPSATNTAQRKEQREGDARFCAKHFQGHVVLSPLHVVLARLGTQVLVEKLQQLKGVARSGLNERLKAAVLKNLSEESISSSKPADRMIDKRYWLSRLADAAADDNSPLGLDYFPIPAAELPQQHGYNKKRKYDASLRPCAAEVSTIFNIFVNVEFTKTDPPTGTSNPLVGASAGVAKCQQAIANADDLLTFQSTRLFVPTLSFHGKGKNTKLFVSILNQERLEFAVVDECFESDSFLTVSALLHLFRTASMYQLGYNPLFTYNLTSPPSDFSVGDAVPASIILPGLRGLVHLNGKRLSQLRSTPFQRSTVVLEGELHADDKEPIPVVVKVAFIAEDRVWRERILVDALYAGDEDAPAYAPELVAAFAAHGSPPLNCEILHTRRKRPASDVMALPAMVRRHLEVMIFASPREARKLMDISATDLLAVAKQLFLSILDAFRRHGVIHRDISVNNILFADNKLLMIDWELGRRFVEPFTGQGTVTGTLDTMSVANLMMVDPLPHDEIESAIYVLVKVLTQTFKPREDLRGEWRDILTQYHWDNPDVKPGTLQQLRILLWSKTSFYSGTTIGATLNIFRLSGHLASAQLLQALFSLPLPIERHEVDRSNHATVLSSFTVLVDKAVAALASVDASSLAREI
ncbi:hypothetical protein DFH07DRAFT_1056104 [Mycena maculata]|uniref:Fungal-type protein kinase domain-containing protein n=1 Tax=Mycena maculata TaxID=230809 RepID=A0AAD7K820_9AGAR|nr:hypothetical protein DFH07DRAFT_1056104 [Mycena maculata]